MTSQIVLNKMFVKDQDPLRTYIVDPSFYNNVDTREFNTIQGAIDQAIIDNGYITDYSDGVAIMVYPGKYNEQIHSRDGYHIQGVTYAGAPHKKPVVLYNTGTGAADYPLRSNDDDFYHISNMTIETAPGGIIGKFGSYSFSSTVFNKCHFIEATANQTAFLALDSCTFLDSKVFDLFGVGSGGTRIMTINDCWFGENSLAGHWRLDSTHTTTLVIIKNSLFHRFYPDIGGNWKVESSNCHIFGTERTLISTTNHVAYLQCILSNGLHFTSNPDAIVHLSTFNDDCGYAISGADITASVTVTDVDYVENVQQNGISGKIQIATDARNVGSESINRYYSLQDAISSIPSSGSVIVEVWEDLTNLPEITLPNANVNIKIKGNKAYSLTFTGDIVEVGNDRVLGFNDMVTVSGGNIELNGTNNELGFESCQYVNAYVTLTNGAFAILYKSSLFGAAGHPAVTIATTSPTVVIGYSRCQGAVGHPAVLFTATASNKFKAKYSTFIHGTKLGNNAIQNTSGVKVDVEIYSCGFNKDWDAADIDNIIVQSNNTVDEKVTF